MEISVIIPSYKPGSYLWECLGSLANQTLDKSLYEVILVLNGCREPYLSRIKEWIDANPLPVTLVQTDRGGVSNARNIGIERARGRYLTFIDDDDFVSPEYLGKLLEKADSDTVVFSDSRSFDDGTVDYNDNYVNHLCYVNNRGKSKPSLLQVRTLLNIPWLKLIPREIIGGYRFDPSLKNREDSLFMFAISGKIRRMAFADESAVYYRRFRQGSAFTGSKSMAYKLSNGIKIMGKYAALWCRNPLSYDFSFFLSRLAGTVKGIIKD